MGPSPLILDNALYFADAPAPFLGGRQPCEPIRNTTGIPGQSGNPPPSTTGKLAVIPLEIAAAWQPDAWPYVYHGARQPYDAFGKMSPGIPGQDRDAPPSAMPGALSMAAQIVAIWQPDPWIYTFTGNRTQPFDSRNNSPGISGQSNALPPSTMPGALSMAQQIASIWQPDPWDYAASGARQAYELNKNAPGISGQSIGLPPSTVGGPNDVTGQIIAIWQPDPFAYAPIGARQPYEPKKNASGIPGQSTALPPSAISGALSMAQQIVAAWQPEPWSYSPTGARQAYELNKNAPGIPGSSTNRPPSTEPGALSAALQIAGQWQPDPFTYAPIGARQPYEVAKLSAAIPGQWISRAATTIGGPVNLTAQVIALWQPDPWVYAIVGRQPHEPKRNAPGIPGQSVNAPRPSATGGPAVILSQIAMMWQPDPWVYAFHGAKQPYGAETLSTIDAQVSFYNLVAGATSYTVASNPAVLTYVFSQWIPVAAPSTTWTIVDE